MHPHFATAYLAGAVCAVIYVLASFPASERRVGTGEPSARDRRRVRIVADYGLPAVAALIATLWPAAVAVAISNWFDRPDGPSGDPQDRVPPRWR